MRVIGCGHKGREANDDVPGALFALGAAAIDCRLLRRGNEVSALWSYGLEMVTAKSQRLTAIAVGEQPEVADLDEATRQNVKQKATDELNRIEAHHLDAVVVSGVAPLKTHLPVVQVQEPAIGEGNTMSVACQVLEHILRAAERCLGIDDPFLMAQRGEHCVERAWRMQLEYLGSAVGGCRKRVSGRPASCHGTCS